MEETKIIEGNKLIAEFIGKSRDWNDSKKGAIKLYCRFDSPDSPNCEAHELKYHSSWDWLMPVVEKISKHNFEDLDHAYPRTFGMLDSSEKPMFRFNRFQLFTSDTLIEATWLAVVDFIKWNATASINN